MAAFNLRMLLNRVLFDRATNCNKNQPINEACFTNQPKPTKKKTTSTPCQSRTAQLTAHNQSTKNNPHQQTLGPNPPTFLSSGKLSGAAISSTLGNINSSNAGKNASPCVLNRKPKSSARLTCSSTSSSPDTRHIGDQGGGRGQDGGHVQRQR